MFETWLKRSGRYQDMIQTELRERRPVFDLVRAWCGRPSGEAFDEVEALRAEVERLGQLIEEAARRLEAAGRHAAARQLRQERASADGTTSASRPAVGG